jgi:hypothetical protein
MHSHHYKLRALIVLPALLLATHAFAERLYKWVDADGQIHYSSRLPPETSRHERKLITEKGRTLKVYRAPLTPEEKAEEERLEKLKEKQEKIAEQRRIHDRSLLATFSSKQDMMLARDNKVATVESLILLTTSRINSMQEQLLKFTEEAAAYERSGKKLPAALQSQISKLRNQIAKNKSFSKNKKLEVETIKRQFDTDIKRYSELTTEKPVAAANKEESSALETAMNNPEVELTSDDRTLLATYATEKDILFTRDQQISNINTEITENLSRLDTMQQQLSELSNTADEYQTRSEPLPDKLLHQMKDLIGKISGTEKLLKEKRAAIQDMEKKFAVDIERYRMLTASR